MFGKTTLLVALLTLLMLLVALPVVAQQDAGGDLLPEEGGSQASPPDPASTASLGLDPDADDADFLQYAPSNPDAGQATPVCPGLAAPGTARCHSIVLLPTDTPSAQ